MKHLFKVLATIAALAAQPLHIYAQGTAFTYQGVLNNGASAATGLYDFTFTLFGASSGGAPLAGPLTNSSTAVAGGQFIATLDFGSNVFAGQNAWLEIAVRTNGSATFNTLAPRQQVTPAPYAIYAESSGTANSIVGGSGGGWSLTGNGGTTPGTDFLGTTDDQPLELWVNGGRAFRLEPGNGSPNVLGGRGGSADPSATGATIGGGVLNTVGTGSSATVSGGFENTVSNLYPTVSGGEFNLAGANGAAVGGGYNNTASGREAAVAGGAQNVASGDGAAIGGGGYDGTSVIGNTASGRASTVGGGMDNLGLGDYAAVLGGYNNNASGIYSTVPGGTLNVASGPASFAAGHQAQAMHDGSFVWADDTGGAFVSTANDQFSVRANGGVRFVTGGAGVTIDGVPLGTGGGGGGGTNGWLLSGNAGANPANGYFLGTIDTNALELRVDGLRGMRLDDAFDGLNEGINLTGGHWNNSIINGSAGATIAGGGGDFHFTDIHGTHIVYNVNTVTGSYGTVGGGDANTAGYEATVPGGGNNSAAGKGSFAAGRNAHTSYDGSFVWGDGTQAANGTASNRFEVLATGGVNLYTGTVGINTGTPRQALDVNGGFVEVQGNGAQVGIGSISASEVEVGSFNNAVTAVSFVNLSTFAPMHINCSSLTILGGADLAEPFQISPAKQEAAQGSVLVIDDANPGHLKLSDRPYDARVAGVISGAEGINPGIQMQQQGLLEGGRNVALTGRVYVQADASNGPIKPGDLLTTSSIPAHAMKVTDHAKAQGAVLGKAMTGLEKGEGMVLVLVTLQ